MAQYTVAVRTLCEFTAKAGDLDLRFTPSPSAQEGIDGHALVAGRRGPGHEVEITLAGDFGPLHVRGRADGYDAARNRLEEVKTHRGRLDRQPDNHRALHWAQAQTYGWLMCQARGLAQIELALVYLDVASQQETVFTQQVSAVDLCHQFEARCGAFLAWAESELAHRSARDEALSALAFPHATFRHGQRALAEAVFKVARAGRCLMAQAPTGIGKTVGTLFPLLKAMPERLDRVFFLTAKTSGRALALDALALLSGRPASTAEAASSPPESALHTLPARIFPLRVLELVARDKACEHPDKACNGESCPLAEGFYDRLGAARHAALSLPDWRRDSVRQLAARHHICPYYLGQELAHWSDVVVGDYNHFFDSAAMLHGLSALHRWRVALLVDEAHNLVERARKMYSAEFDPARLKAIKRGAPAPLKKAFERVQRRWSALAAEHPLDYQVLDAAPDKLLDALQQATTAVFDHLAEHPIDVQPLWLDFCFDALAITRLAESFGEHSLFDLARSTQGAQPGVTLCLRNVVPAPFLTPRLAAAHSTTLFSATLQPRRYHADLLGLPDDTAWIDVDSPFEARQLSVQIARHISTRWQHRSASLAPVVALIARQYAERPGNYLAFFSSFDYLERVAARFAEHHPEVPLWRQARGMSEAAQAQFLAQFRPGGCGIGFAVLGGSFAEGIDLPGERLVGAFIATLGMPQVNAVNEQIRQRIERLCGAGFDYTYLYPGLQKVVQAAGRVIRTTRDQGVVHLLDDRFGRREVRTLLPAWWQMDDGVGGSDAASNLAPMRIG
ncbi:helicase c2 [Leptothrix cholodnii SP-6]|uniref:Helicase c2 n=1 Tax=Leptothrix cholodnii (strain ATCC 51168 / LMG 8142 / SP-6) TaxID=395495 RepID=B1Y6D9_LEPCP|nr:ATP-dependent DNA helicase [Leptothrix cholodnii]ACB34775.1 helicase c2 [Leptothrix cholodnii SP-6]